MEGTRHAIEEKISDVLEALVMYDFARSLTGISSEAPIVTTLEVGATRDVALRDATRVLLRNMFDKVTHCRHRNRILTGSKGMGKSFILMAIARICALLEFANPGQIIACAYVPNPYPDLMLTPTTYIVKALLNRKLLLGTDGSPPDWAVKRVDVRGQQLYEWCRARGIIPVLLLDEAADIRGVKYAQMRRFKSDLGDLCYPGGGRGMIRLSGTWTQLPRLLYSKEFGGIDLHHQKLAQETLVSGLKPAEAALMVLYGDNVGEEDEYALEVLLARHMLLKDGHFLGKTGFLAGSGSRQFSLSDARERMIEVGGNRAKFLIAARVLLSRLQFLSGGVSRFYSDERDSALVQSKLVARMRSDLSFRSFAEWLVGVTLALYPEVMQLSEEEFATRTVPINELALREAVKVGDPDFDKMDRAEVAMATTELLDSAVSENLVHLGSNGV